jgi:hypothetical protein
MDLGQGLVRLIDKEEEVGREIIEEARRGVACGAATEVAGIVLDAFAGANGAEHLEVIGGALLDALPLDEFVSFSKKSTRSLSSALMVSTARQRTSSGVTW